MTSDQEGAGRKSPSGEESAATGPAPEGGSSDQPEVSAEGASVNPPAGETPGETPASQDEISLSDSAEDPYQYEEEGYVYGSDKNSALAVEQKPAAPAPADRGGKAPPPPPPTDGGDDDDEHGMVRMSFLEHLEELRRRILLSLAGVGVAFLLCIIFANELWLIVSAPAVEALTRVGAEPYLAQIRPMDAFVTIWVKVPMLTAIFLASPWILYQVWAFIAPGLYKRERRWAGPFVICTAGLFILGGLFAYFVAFRFGLAFLLGIGKDINVTPVVSLTEYFNLFVNVTLGLGLIFELPVLIFFLTLLRVVSPQFLLRHTRYAILIIVIIAALVTPTPDVVNLMLFSVPMCGLYFVGVFASYLLVLHREQRRFPWKKTLYGVLIGLAVIAAALLVLILNYGYHLAPKWPFLMR